MNAGFAPDTTTIGGILRATDCCNFLGNIDDVAIWNVALADTDIAALAGGLSPLQVPEPSSLVLCLLGLLSIARIRARR